MRWIVFTLVIFLILPISTAAMDFSAPTAPSDVRDLMPVQIDSFSDGLWHVVKESVGKIAPDIKECAIICIALVAIAMLCSILQQFPGKSVNALHICASIAVGTLLLGKTSSMITLGTETVSKLSDYGKLLLPVMASALAAQGGTTGAATIYAGTAAFDAVLSAAIGKLLVPMVYLYLAASVAASAVGETMLGKLRDLIKWLMSWGLKIVLYIFTGYISITGVISGSVDASAIKAAKLTISGVVPVVGGILSDASEAVLVSAGVMKNSVGVYGMIVIAAIWLSPFLTLGIHYLLLKLCSAICEGFGVKVVSNLVKNFSGAMGLLLGMTGAVCFMLMVSMVCFMKGVS